MGFQINYGGFAFAVPGDVVDHYIRLADGDKLKVLLFLLRHASENVTADAAASYLRITREQAEEAIQFWEQAGVLRADGVPSGTSFAFAAPVQEPPKPEAPQPAEPKYSVQRSSADLKIDPSVLAAEIERSEELQYLYKKAEEKLGELKKMHLNSLYWIKEYLNFPVESIIMLLEYCARIEKTDFRYIESIAISWHDKDIITFKQVEEEIARLTKEHTFTSEIRSLFELKRSPTTKQKSYIDLWQNAGYPMELIKYAYEISVENIEKADFKYINTILLGWAENGIRDLAGAQKLREQPRQGAKKARAPQPASQEELDKMNKYLSLVNRFKEDDTNE